MNEIEKPEKAKVNWKVIIENLRDLVRPLVSLSIVGTGVFLAITGKIKPETFWATAGLVIGFYYGERSALKKPDSG